MTSAAPVSDLPVDRAAPRFSIVTAVYDVARYLDEFIASVEAQDLGLDDVEVVMVDDGSNDDSLRILQDWQARSPDLVRVLHQENAGQGAARNHGLTVATGEWVTFTDPDDTLAPSYLRLVDEFIRANESVQMIATARIMHDEKTGRIHNGHPLRRMFVREQLVDLDRFPDYFHGSAPAAFFRRALIEEAGLTFDGRIRPNFEDGHFCCLYLLHAPAPLVGFVARARYYYRKRADQSSTLQTAGLQVGRFVDVPRHGYLAALRAGAAATGTAPEWLQNFIIYELSWYFQDEQAMSNAPSVAHGAVGAEIVSTLTEISRLLDPTVISQFAIRRFDPAWREILTHGLGRGDWHAPYVVMERYDRRERLLRISYRYHGRRPAEQVLVRGLEVEPVVAKDRGLWFFGAPLLTERVLWIPANGTVRVQLDGVPVEIRNSAPPPPRMSVRPAKIEETFTKAAPSTRKRRPSRAARRAAWVDRQVLRLARSLPARYLFRRAWVIMDRVDTADDNGERLFEYVRRAEPGINAWFVLDDHAPDWRRLRRTRQGHRLVAYGSLVWKLLMINAAHVISSHVDVAIYAPREIVRLRPNPARFTFLQHGVIKDDISRWLNHKKIDLLVTSTRAEHESIVGANTPYRATAKETQRVGLARFDRLKQLADATPDDQRRLVLLAPTWREWLNLPLTSGSYRRAVRPDFVETDYARAWLGLLGSSAVRDLAAQGYRIGFLPHPNVQPILADLDLPTWVEPLTFDDDVQRLFAQSAVMITDYSSTAFNVAGVGRPVVYYQFDRELVEAGGHLGRTGYFDYQRDGFGPVAETQDEVVAALTELVERGCAPGEPYQARIDAAFDLVDGRCCERTVQAIRAL